jgi:Na+-transporting NADH:ubiquinone oxidoreductase subunit F
MQQIDTENESFSVTINQGTILLVNGGNSLLRCLSDNHIYLPSACGGRGLCGLCKLRIINDTGPLQPAEIKKLTEDERIHQNLRLACQVKVQSNIQVEIPPEFLVNQSFLATLESKLELTYDTIRFRFKMAESDSLDFIPGQFVQLICPPYKGSPYPVQRAYSIASDPAKPELLDLIIRKVPNGICTTWCFEYLQPGQRVRFSGPFGDFRLSGTTAPMIFIAGGSGMAPFVSILHQMLNTSNPRSAVYFFGGNKQDDLYLLDRMCQFERQLASFRFVPVVAARDPQWKGQSGLVTEAVERLCSDLHDHEAYLCGSPGMIDACIAALKRRGVDPAKIYYDKYA